MTINLAVDGFFMILGRLTGLFISAPIFSSRQLPGRLKILIVILLAGVMSSFVPVQYAVELNNAVAFIAAFILEVLIGYAIGFVAWVLFAAIQMAGQLMDNQIGFSMVNVLDPQSGIQIPLMGNFYYLLTLLIYLSMDGHHYLLQAINQSYQVIPVLGANLSGGFMEIIASVTAYMVVIAVKISTPVVFAILISDISMGFVARTVPQMNVFIVGMPVKIMVGLLTLIIIMPVFIWFMGTMFYEFTKYLDAVVLSMGL